MKKLLINFVIFFFISSGISNIAVASNIKQSDDKSDRGSIVLREVLLAHQLLASSKQSSADNMKIPKSIILLGEKKYEVVSFKFENAAGASSEETFEEYAKSNNLLYMRSILSRSPENDSTILEVFDSSKANLDDSISFYISLRRL